MSSSSVTNSKNRRTYDVKAGAEMLWRPYTNLMAPEEPKVMYGEFVEWIWDTKKNIRLGFMAVTRMPAITLEKRVLFKTLMEWGEVTEKRDIPNFIPPEATKNGESEETAAEPTANTQDSQDLQNQ